MIWYSAAPAAANAKQPSSERKRVRGGLASVLPLFCCSSRCCCCCCCCCCQRRRRRQPQLFLSGEQRTTAARPRTGFADHLQFLVWFGLVWFGFCFVFFAKLLQQCFWPPCSCRCFFSGSSRLYVMIMIYDYDEDHDYDCRDRGVTLHCTSAWCRRVRVDAAKRVFSALSSRSRLSAKPWRGPCRV